MAETKATVSSDQPGFLSKALKIASIPIAAVSGYIATKITVRHDAYENAKPHELVSDLTGKKSDRLKEMIKYGKEAKKAALAGKPYNLLEKTVPLHAKHEAEIVKRMEKVGLGSLPEQWKFISTYQKQSAVINGLTIAGIAVGALFSIANSKWLSHAFSKQEAEKQAEQGPSV